jgi:hypothetical protein
MIPTRLECDVKIQCRNISDVHSSVIGTCEAGVSVTVKGADLGPILTELCDIYGEDDVAAWVKETPQRGNPETYYDAASIVLREFLSIHDAVHISNFEAWLRKKSQNLKKKGD